MTSSTIDRPAAAEAARRLAFVALIVGASLVFSRALACATPFAALATVAGTRMRWRDAAAAVLFAWGTNQAVGFGLLHYPHTAATFGWGIAIGLAACAAAGTASILSRWTGRVAAVHAAWRTVVVLAAAYAAYEGVLFAATAVLPSTHAAFAPAVVARLGGINLAACAVLLVVRHAAGWCGLDPRPSRASPV